MNDSRSHVDLWTAEYESGGIPSSIRNTPSGSVVWAVAELRHRNARLATAVDVGCGKGRNSLYLASQGMKVTALDFTPNAVETLEKEAVAANLQGSIRAMVHDVTEPWPIGRDDVDLVVDAFCFKHIAPHELRQAYRRNMLGVLSMSGHYMISFASIGDGYYGRYRANPDDASAIEDVALDPVNGIESVLFTRRRILEFFAPELSLCCEVKRSKPVTMHGAEYERETYAMLFKRASGHFVC